MVACRTGLPVEYWLRDSRRLATVLELYAATADQDKQAPGRVRVDGA